MHIAIEGMDGAGKTTQAKRLAQRINGEFIPKSFHEMNDTSGIYDNFATIKQYTGNVLNGNYGIRLNYLAAKLEKRDIVTDRFYVSNYWSRAEIFDSEYFKDISLVWGEPDIIIILYAKSEILHNRIFLRNNHDKDLGKTKKSESAYNLMFDIVRKLKFKALVIDTSEISFDETSDIIYFAYREGVDKCLKKFDNCWMIEPIRNIIENDTGTFECCDDELLACFNKSELIKIPEGISCIRERAFSNCVGSIEIFLHKNIKKISDFALANVYIKKIVVDKENLIFASFDGVLYNYGFTTLIKVPNLKTFLKFENVEQIANLAFYGCNELQNVELPENLKKVGYFAFGNCKILRSIAFHNNSVEHLCATCFYGCNALDTVSINSDNYSVKSGLLFDKVGNIFFCVNKIQGTSMYKIESKYIYPYAFFARVDVEKLELNVTKIGSFAFQNCNIGEVFNSTNIKDIGEKSFVESNIRKVFFPSIDIVPSVWKNSFDLNTFVILASEKNKESFSGSRNWDSYNLCVILVSKNEKTLCGSACVEYIIAANKSSENFKTLVNPNMLWVTEISMAIEQHLDAKTSLFYYQSLLMNDYIHKVNMDCEPLKMMTEYIASHNSVEELLIDVENLKCLNNNYNNLIFCVDSKIIFQDDSLCGNHFVILKFLNDRYVDLISPGKNLFFEMRISIERFMNSIKGNGQWVIGVRND